MAPHRYYAAELSVSPGDAPCPERTGTRNDLVAPYPADNQ
jgi:hypothetical protein